MAHIVSYEELSILGLLKRFAKGRVVHANEVGVKEFAQLSPDLERLETLRRSLLVPQHGAFRHPRAQPDLNVWVGPRDMFRIHQPRKAQPPASWITERR